MGTWGREVSREWGHGVWESLLNKGRGVEGVSREWGCRGGVSCEWGCGAGESLSLLNKGRGAGESLVNGDMGWGNLS